jgi:glycosyltransferase involved in cell wall biosynthesis
MDKKMKPRVALLGPSLTAVSGFSTHVNMLIASDLAEKFDLIHFQVGSEGRHETGLKSFVRLVFSPFELVFFVLRHRPAVVHINTGLDQKAYWRDLVYLLLVKLMGRRVVYQIHGGPFPRDFFSGSILLTRILKQALLISDAVTVLSSGELAAYRAFDARINVHLVPNAIDPSGINDQPRVFNRDRPLRLVYIGRLVRTKGLFEIIDALVLLKNQGRHFHFTVAGGGADDIELRSATTKAGLDNHVEFLGSVFGEPKNRLWLESDIFVFPTYFEGLPYALLEAMAAGCVPVTTPVAAIPDVIEDGLHGLLIPSQDPQRLASAIARLDDNREQLVKMAGSCREHILKQYTVTRLAADFEKIYSDAIQR